MIVDRSRPRLRFQDSCKRSLLAIHRNLRDNNNLPSMWGPPQERT